MKIPAPTKIAEYYTALTGLSPYEYPSLFQAFSLGYAAGWTDRGEL